MVDVFLISSSSSQSAAVAALLPLSRVPVVDWRDQDQLRTGLVGAIECR